MSGKVLFGVKVSGLDLVECDSGLTQSELSSVECGCLGRCSLGSKSFRSILSWAVTLGVTCWLSLDFI